MQLVNMLSVFSLAMLFPAAGATSDSEQLVFWQESDEQNESTIDHDAWGEFLGAYVVADESGINKVAYDSVSAADRKKLKNYILQLTGLDPRQYREAEQLAYWINLYNALTVEVVLRNPDKKSIRRMGSSFFSNGPWGDPLIDIAGQALSLDDIEHRILRAFWKDHRIHYALNCASLSCPNMIAESYTADNSQRLLNTGEREYINHERGVSFDQRGRLRLSNIYKWYSRDFADNDAELLRYLSKHHRTLAARLRDYQGPIGYHYDWHLNSTGS